MFIRFMLVGAVTCLGLDLPLRSDAGRVGPPRCAACCARSAPGAPTAAEAPKLPEEELLPMPNAEAVFASSPVEETSDAEFDTALAATVTTFGEDLAWDFDRPAPATEGALITSQPEAAEEEAADRYPGLAYELNRHAQDALPIATEVITKEEVESHPYWSIDTNIHCTADPAPEAFQVAEGRARGSLDAARPEDTRSDRLGEAVRLTGQAIHAWLSLLQAPSLALDDAPESPISR